MKNIFSYHFDASTGNLLSRKDNIRNITEEFEYDNLNRLTSAGNLTMQYNKLGNITAKSDVGSFEYDNNKPYAIVGATLAVAQNAQFTEPQNVTYNALQLPVSITQGQDSVRFKYNSNGQRTTMQTDGGENFYFSNKYEIINSKEILYLCGDAYSAPAAMVKQNDTWQTYYIGRDYLGSITHIIDEDGTLQYEYSYDAWGNLRNPETQTNYTVPELFLGRGYTGHEHLQGFGLINMNARLYDPALGRFLNPDPIIQDATNKQNFNLYSYVLNNPLKYTDPSGMKKKKQSSYYEFDPDTQQWYDDEGNVVSWDEVYKGLIGNGWDISFENKYYSSNFGFTAGYGPGAGAGSPPPVQYSYNSNGSVKSIKITAKSWNEAMKIFEGIGNIIGVSTVIFDIINGENITEIIWDAAGLLPYVGTAQSVGEALNWGAKTIDAEGRASMKRGDYNTISDYNDGKLFDYILHTVGIWLSDFFKPYGYRASDGNYYLNDGSGYYDANNNFHSYY